ncbi:VOC family protein [Oscillatoriales cyanobacterium LEGE 11467]|uniref:VOC family protein n=1 Tax=Zarconia navalis LEGE 11467 TaxID=1828826 RepID=A0A928VZG6_9CYAN|nr:glyoxalase superfamily protein [Zarconia navalis]MBE9042108.1 VOC family protein [Zarconia navalis LEGE 11467]
MKKAIEFYQNKLGFTITHQEGNPIEMAIIERDGASIFLVENDDRNLAEGTSLRIEVEGVEELYAEFQAKGEDIVHPKGKLETKPWGSKEFSVLDLAGVCIAFYEFVELD